MKRIVASAALVVAALTAGAVPVEWTFPREGGCHEGLPFSDGVTGVLVWGGGDTVKLTVGRGDLWDHRGGYVWEARQNYTDICRLAQSGDLEGLVGLFSKVTPKGEPRNPYMLPLGRVTVKVPGWELKGGTLDPFTGLGRLVFEKDGATMEARIATAKGAAFAMKFPAEAKPEASVTPSLDFPKVAKALLPLGFRQPVRSADGFDWELPADPSVSLRCAVKDGELTIGTSRGGAKPVVGTAFAAVEKASVDYWTRFWKESARVKVPDADVQRMFDYGMYKFGAMTDPDGIAAGLQGQWLEDDKLVPWNGDYHFNINVQECYAPAFRGGHFANLLPLFRMVLSWKDTLRRNAKMFVGIDDGYCLPHSVSDRGVNIGGFWTGTIDHGSTAWTADLMFRYVKYSRDVAFLKSEAYDFMKGAMNVYRAMMSEEGGRLAIPVGPSPEWGGAMPQEAIGRNPSFQLAAAHRLAKDLIAAAEMLGEKPDPMWFDVEKRLPAYAKGEAGMIALFEGRDLAHSHRHHSHLAGWYPFDTIDFSDPTALQASKDAYSHWVSKGMGMWSGWCVPWASILDTHVGNPDAALFRLKLWDRFYCNPGHGSRHDVYLPGVATMSRGSGRDVFGIHQDQPGEEIMQMDGQCASAVAILEMMVHEVNGKAEFFRGCPAEWKDVSFENLATSDGRRISGRRLNGKVEISDTSR